MPAPSIMASQSLAVSHRIELLEKRIQHHADAISNLQSELEVLRKEEATHRGNGEEAEPIAAPPKASARYPLLKEEYRRYGRQLIMPEVGLQGQLWLKNSSVLIIGAGGLGCPAAAYLAGAGVGTLGIVDGDTVEESNLHRQILHGGNMGMSKSESAVMNMSVLNPLTKYNIHKTHLMPANASSIVSSYDLVLDCTDTPASRYLISDTCVLLQKPLVSASALRTEGQLMLLNHPARPPADVTGGPCYRCIFPVPPPAASVLSCGEGGILGPVVGVMGVLQALEAIKMIASGECAIAKHPEPTMRTVTRAPSMLLFSAYQDGQFRSIRMRRRNPKCAVCSAAATVSLQSLDSGSMDYVQFCGSSAPAQLLSPEDRITAVAYADILQTHQPHIVLDVREKVQFDLCHLEGSLNLPFSETVCSGYETQEQINSFVTKVQGLTITDPIAPLYVVCRLGNDSQVVVKRLKELGFDDNGQRWVGDIKGGLRAWTNEVDQDFPDY